MFEESMPGAYFLLAETPLFVFSIHRKLPFYVHCPLFGSLTMASLLE